MARARARIDAAVRHSAPVRERARFVAREVSGRRSVAAYRPRGTDITVFVRHNYPAPGRGSIDYFPLREIFDERCYEVPEPVKSALLEARSGQQIVDLGAHLGYFGAFVLSRFPRANVVGFEPESSHAELLRRCIARNGLDDRWRVLEACAHTEDGTLELAAGHSVASQLASFSSDPRDIIQVRALDVFPYLADADLVKMDVEGAEWEVLLDHRFATARPRAVVLEYHSIGCPADNPKRAAVERFESLGYTVQLPRSDTNPDSAPFWGRGLLWAWRP